MKKYSFEYFNRGYYLKLLGVCFLIFVPLIYCVRILNNTINPIITVIFAMGIPAIIFWLNKKKITQIASATIFESYVEFNLRNAVTKINYDDIKSYLVQEFNGTVLNIKLKNGKRFNVASNTNFNDCSSFKIFSEDFEKKLQEWKGKNEVDLVRRKTFFEQVWVFPLLIVFTCGIIYIFLHSLFTGKKLPISSIFITIGPLIALWTGYFAVKKNKKY